MALIIDIETIGEDFDALDKETRADLTRWIKRESTDEEEYKVLLKDLREALGFSPLTGEIVAIGVLDSQKNKGVVYFQSPGKNQKIAKAQTIELKSATEKEMLASFWQGAREYSEFVTFNGRAFDVPFIVARSARHGIKPTKDLMSNRYLGLQRGTARHIDLLDQLSFYGSVRRKGSLHLWCRFFSIKSPKVGGVKGDEVAALFRAGEFRKIALYNARDLRATFELYKKWSEFFNIY